MRTKMETPWGVADHQTTIAEGIVSVATPSHGGIWLSGPRRIEMEARFTFKTFAGGPWYEEDEDVAAVMVAFPQYFDDRAVYYAVRTVKAERSSRWESAATWLECDHPSAVFAMQKHDAYAAKVANSWEVGFRASGPEWAGDRAWAVGLTHVATRERRTVTFADYPTKSHYTTEELSEVTLTKPVAVAV